MHDDRDVRLEPTNRRSFTRRAFIGSLGVGAVAVAVGVEGRYWQPGRVSVTHHRLGSPIGSEPPTLRFAQLTDLHLPSINSFHEKIAEKLEEINPDFLVFTGDTIDGRAGLSPLPDFLSLLNPRTPGYAIIGNWDRWSGVPQRSLQEVYERHFTQLIFNSSALVTKDGKRLNLLGIDDMVSGSPDLDEALGSVGSGEENILLSHCPGFLHRIRPSQGNALTAVISGHTHGGQVALFGWAPRTPRGSGGFVSGWYRTEGQPDLYVSRGLGTSVIPVRFGSVPEISVFDWYPSTI